jgi:ribosomal-protein-alanine N-acetyltransferase
MFAVEARTARLVLRPLRPEDHDAFVQLHRASADLYAPWFPDPPAGQTLEARFAEELARVTDGAMRETQLRLAALLPSGQIAALVNLTEIVRGAFQNAYAGWSVNAEVAGQGYASEAVRGLLDLAFAPASAGGLALHRVQANVVPENVRSVRLAERVGLRYEGTALRYLRIAGAWRDHRMYARTVEEHRPV